MSVPKYYEMMNPVLKALHRLGGSATIKEMEENVAQILELTEEELNEVHRGNTTKFCYRLAWARSYLKNYGLLDNSLRGVWGLTSKGNKLESVDKNLVVKAYRDKYKKVSSGISLNDDTDVVELEELKWQDELLEVITNITPSSFENLCKRFLRESGFDDMEVTGQTGDGGIDGRGVLKLGGLLTFKIVFQAKRYQGSVSTSVVRDFRGAMIGRADRGLIITTGKFTKDATVEAQRDGAPPIDLIDGNELVLKLKDLLLGVDITEEVTEKIEIKKDWFMNL